MKRHTKILLLLALTLVLGYLIVVPHGGYRRQVAAYKKQLLAQGEKLTIAELIPPPSTDGLAAAKNLPGAPSIPRPFYDLSAMKLIGPGLAKVGHAGVTPQQLGEYDRSVHAATELRNALNVPVLDFNLDYTNLAHWENSSLLASVLSGLKSRELLAVNTAMLALHQKDGVEASLDLNAAVDLVRLNNHETTLISDLVRVSNARIAVATTWEALQSDLLTDAQLAALQEKWRQSELFAPASSALAMERATLIESLAWFRNSYNSNALAPVTTRSLTIVFTNSARVMATDGWLAGLKKKFGAFYDRYPRYWYWRSSWSYDEELFALKTYEAALATAHQANATGAFLPALAEFDQQTTGLTNLYAHDDPRFLVFRLENVPGLRTYLIRMARSENSRRLAVTAIALKRHHLLHAAYPAALEELVPAFLPQVPADFMDGQPLRYRLNPDGNFLLYSVGQDGKDDGGDATSGSVSLNDWEGARDIVWPRAATPQELENSLKHAPAATRSPAR